MDGNHPKRKKDKDNPYVLSVEDGSYFISFSDGQGVYHREQVDEKLYTVFDQYELEDISHLNVVSRHYEHSDLTEGTLNQRATVAPELLEDQVYRKLLYQKLHKAILTLPEIQRRRLLLYYFNGYTFEQISEMEGCTKRAVKFSVDIALKKLKDFF